MSITAKQKITTKNRNQLLIRTINSKKKHNDLVVTFVHFDKSKRTLTLNKEFYYDEKGKQLNPYQLITKLNTLKHDFNAKYYKIKKI